MGFRNNTILKGEFLMSKTTKLLIIVLIVSWVGAVIFISGGHQQLVTFMEKSDELSRALNEKNHVAEQYQLQLSELEAQHLRLKDENERLKEVIESIGVSDCLELTTLDRSIQWVTDHILLNISLDETKVLELFGTPVQESLEVIVFDKMKYPEEGSFKKSVYDRWTLLFYRDKEKEYYELVAISTENNDTRLFSGIKVGDSVEFLNLCYPMLVKEKDVYSYIDDEKIVNFYSVDGEIKKITVGVAFK